MMILDCVFAAGGSIIDLDATFFILVGIFFVVMLLLTTLLFKPIFKVLDARRTATEGAVEESRKLSREADEKRREYERLLQDIKRKATADREVMRLESRKAEAEALEKGKRDATAILEEARVTLHADVDQARKNLDEESRMLGELLASRVLSGLGTRSPSPSGAPVPSAGGGLGRLSSLGTLGKPGPAAGGKP